MGMFSTIAFGLWGDRALLVTALVYARCFRRRRLSVARRGLRTPGGLLITCAVGMAPLAIFALQSMFDPIRRARRALSGLLRLDQVELAADGARNDRARRCSP